MQAVEPRLNASIFAVLSIDLALQVRNSFGGTPEQVAAHIKATRANLAKRVNNP